MKEFDVAIIGSGPSGASAALKLAKNNISTVIIEKETLPRYKVCGGGFVYRGRKNMPFDVSSVIDKEFFKIDIYFNKIDVHLVSEREQPIISMIMRDDFDNFLVEKAKDDGVTLLQNHKLKDISFDDKITLHTSQGDIKTKFVIAADGALSPTAKLSGWKEDTRILVPALEYEVEVTSKDFERLSKSVRFDFDAAPMGYGWCFPKKNHLSIGLASFNKQKGKLNLKKLYREYMTNVLGIHEVVNEKMFGFQIPVSPRKEFVKNNVFLVGDAAGFADPLTAEGISNAILSGVLVADAIIESQLDSTKAAENYKQKLNTSILPEIKTAVPLAQLFYKNKTVRNFLIKKKGQLICDRMTEVFMGEKTYPKDIMQTIQNKLKNYILS